MIKDLILAIAEGDTIAIDNSFNAVMAQKISSRLDDLRVDVAQNMFGSVVEESVELDEGHSVLFKMKKTDRKVSAAHYNSKEDAQKFLDSVKAKGGDGMVRSKSTNEELDNYSIEELEDFMMSEDFEQLDELSKKTLGSYVKKASLDNADRGINYGSGLDQNTKSIHKILKRAKNIDKAVDKITKESVDLDESDTNVGPLIMNHTFSKINSIRALRDKLNDSLKIKIENDNKWLVVEGCPWDDEILMCHDEKTKKQYDLSLHNLINKKITFVPKD